jgi:hypothetical protein
MKRTMILAAGLMLAVAFPVSAQTSAPAEEQKSVSGADTKVQFTVDAYALVNTNDPSTRQNSARGYDAKEGLRLNQGVFTFERTVTSKSRFGGRLDLMAGTATDTLQGSAVNEPNPGNVKYLFQAYGSVVGPKNIRFDFGKWASAFGYDGNFTADQMNYSRSFWYNMLPYYHMGLRTTVPMGKVTVTHYLVNGIQQTQDFNRKKSQALLVGVAPNSKFSVNANFYRGTEGYFGGDEALLTILDVIGSFSPTDRLTLVGQLDRVHHTPTGRSEPNRVTGGAAYAKFVTSSKTALALRFERLKDPSQIFSESPMLHEVTATVDWRPRGEMLLRGEWRRDMSSGSFFPTSVIDRGARDQNTFTLGVVYTFGFRLHR